VHLTNSIAYYSCYKATLSLLDATLNVFVLYGANKVDESVE